LEGTSVDHPVQPSCQSKVTTFLMLVISEGNEKMDAGERQTGCSVFLTRRVIISLVCLA